MAKYAPELYEDFKQVLLKHDGTTTEEKARLSFEDEHASARTAALRDERRAHETYTSTALDRQRAAPPSNSTPRLRTPSTNYVPFYPSAAQTMTSSYFETLPDQNFESFDLATDMLMHYTPFLEEELWDRDLYQITSQPFPGDFLESFSNLAGPNLSHRSAPVLPPLPSDIDTSARGTQAYSATERVTENKTSSGNPHRKAMPFNNITISQDRTAAIEVQEKTLLRRAMNGPLQQTTDEQNTQSASKQGSQRGGDPSPNPTEMQRGKLGWSIYFRILANAGTVERSSPVPGMIDPNRIPAKVHAQMMMNLNGQQLRPPSSHLNLTDQMQQQQQQMEAMRQRMGQGVFPPGAQLPQGQRMSGQQPGGRRNDDRRAQTRYSSSRYRTDSYRTDRFTPSTAVYDVDRRRASGGYYR